MLAVGSNASRAVMRRKFERYGVDPRVLFVRARVRGVRVGHSAHVSVPGFIPAAPVADPDATSQLVASLLDDRALAALDATEPSYRRHYFDADDFPLELDVSAGTGIARYAARPPGFWMYESRYGVVAPPGYGPLGLHSQPNLIAELMSRCRQFGSLVSGEPRAVMRRLAADRELRDACRTALATAGWVQPAGLTR